MNVITDSVARLLLVVTFTAGREKVNADVDAADNGDAGDEAGLASFPSLSEKKKKWHIYKQAYNKSKRNK